MNQPSVPQALPGGAQAGSGSCPGPQQTTTENPVPLQRYHAEADPRGKRLAILAFTALGVVYGDIGTSPLYAIKDAFKAVYAIEPTAANVFGLLSMLVWSLVL